MQVTFMFQDKLKAKREREYKTRKLHQSDIDLRN